MNAGPKVVSKIKDISWLKKKQLTVVSGTVGGGLTAFRFWATMVGYNEVGDNQNIVLWDILIAKPCLFGQRIGDVPVRLATAISSYRVDAAATLV